MTKHYQAGVKKTLKWLNSLYQEDGSILGMPQDLACYYKIPFFYFQQGQWSKANRVLDFIQTHFMQDDGDFGNDKNTKSMNSAYGEFWPYANGWIAQAAQRLGRFDISIPAWKYLQSYFDFAKGGWKTHRIPSENSPIDILSTAHLGLTSLYFGDVKKAISSGLLIEYFLQNQYENSPRFYLRINNNGELIRNYPTEMAFFTYIDKHKVNQAYFMLGYPLAFLTKLSQATGDYKFLKVAENYFDWINSVTGNMRNFYYSHKVAWGSAWFAEETGDQRALQLSHAIADYLLSIQKEEGVWIISEDSLTNFDQTIENAIWLYEIASVKEHIYTPF